MAWPLQRFLTFVAQQTPAISAAFLNAVQDAIVGLELGILTVKTLVVDGTGGAAAVPAAPAIGTALPQTAPIRGEYVRDAAPAAMGCVGGGFIDNAGAGLRMGFGIHELHKNAAGDYYVVFTRVPSAAFAYRSVVHVTSVDGDVSVTKTLDGNGRLKASILLGGGADVDFDITAWIF